MANPTFTDDETIVIPLLAGRIYTIAAGDDFGGGSLSAWLILDDDSLVPIPGFPLIGEGTVPNFAATTPRMQLSLFGSTDPNLTYACTLISDSFAAADPAGTAAALLTSQNTWTANQTFPGGFTCSGLTVFGNAATFNYIGAAAATHRTALEINTYTGTLTNKSITPRITTITSSATPTVDTDNCDMVTITALAAAITSMTSGLTGTPANGDMLLYRIKDNGTARAITWGASFEAKGASLPTTTVLSKVLHVLFIWDSVTSKWGCISTSQEA